MLKKLMGRYKRTQNGSEGMTKMASQDVMLNPLSEEFIANPYPALAELRDNNPVHRCVTGGWMLTRYQDVRAALSDPRLSNEPSPYAVLHPRNSGKYLCANVANNILPFLDNEKHQWLRFALGRSFFQAIKSFQGEAGIALLEGIAEETLTPLLTQSEFDVIHDFGTPFSGRVMCQCMGLDLQDLPKLARWSEMFLYLFAPMPSETVRAQVDDALLEFRSYLKNVLADKKNHPQQDWMSALISDNQLSEAPLSDDQLIDALMLFFADGLENVDRFLGTICKLLLEHPEQRDMILADRTLIADFVEECLRYDPPAQFIGRIALEDITLHGQTIKANSAVFLMLGSANRDTRQFPDAEVFSLTHHYKNTLTFGYGHHSCFGKHLVKSQLVAALNVLLRAAPNMTLAPQQWQWEARLAHRWLASCRLCIPKPR